MDVPAGPGRSSAGGIWLCGTGLPSGCSGGCSPSTPPAVLRDAICEKHKPAFFPSPQPERSHQASGEDFQLEQTVRGLFALNFLVGLFGFFLHLKNWHSRACTHDLVSHETQDRKMQLVPSPFRASPAWLPDPFTHCKLSPQLSLSRPQCQGWQCHPSICTSQQDGSSSETAAVIRSQKHPWFWELEQQNLCENEL